MAHAMLLACLIAALLPVLVFVVVYGTRFPWWRSWEGRALFASSSGLLFLLGGLLVEELGRNIPDLLWLPVGVVVIAGAWFKVITLMKAMRQP